MDQKAYDSLTEAERNVLRTLHGRDNGEVASALGVSANTVKSHIANSRRKLGGMPTRRLARELVALEGGTPSIQPSIPSHPKGTSLFAGIAAETGLQPSEGSDLVRRDWREERPYFDYPPVHPTRPVAAENPQDTRLMKLLAAATSTMAVGMIFWGLPHMIRAFAWLSSHMNALLH